MIKSEMPLLKSVISSKKKSEDTVILHINHCMENSFYLNRQFKEIFFDVIFVAVPYNNRIVPESEKYTSYYAQKSKETYTLKRNGKDLEYRNCDFSHAVYGLIFLALENELLKYANQDKKIIIIEDGGYHYNIITKIADRHPIFKTSILGAIEQTTAGTKNSFKQISLSYPVLSVARSLYKTQIESYFVAGRVIDELKRMLHDIGKFIDFHSILLIGYGIVGRSIAKKLASSNTDIQVYDTDREICMVANQDGFSVWKIPYVFCENMIVIGSTGSSSFTSEMLSCFLKGSTKRIYLASASSKQVEFQNIFNELEYCEMKVYGATSTYTFPNGKEIVLIAEGYPLNFYDEFTDSLTFDMIDPVFSEILMLALFLKDEHSTLPNHTFLLGDDSELNSFVSEKDLIGKWLKLNGLNFNIETFNIHPLREKLKKIDYEGELYCL